MDSTAFSEWPSPPHSHKSAQLSQSSGVSETPTLRQHISGSAPPEHRHHYNGSGEDWKSAVQFDEPRQGRHREHFHRLVALASTTPPSSPSSSSAVNAAVPPATAHAPDEDSLIESLRFQLAQAQQRVRDYEARYLREKRQPPHGAGNVADDEGSTPAGAPGGGLRQRMAAVEDSWKERVGAWSNAQRDIGTSLIAEIHRHFMKCSGGDGGAITTQLYEAVAKTLEEACEAQRRVEDRALQQLQAFKAAYRRALDTDFAERCDELESRIEEREEHWMRLLEEERQRTRAAAAGRVSGEGPSERDAALTRALAEGAELRERLARDTAAHHAALLRGAAERQEALAHQYKTAMEQSSEQLRQAQTNHEHALREMQTQLVASQAALAAKETEVCAARQEAQLAINTQVAARCVAQHDEAEKRWTALMEEQLAEHTAATERITLGYQTALSSLRDEQTRRECELREAYEQRVVAAEAAAAERWTVSVAAADSAVGRHLEVIRDLRQRNEQLAARSAALSDELELKSAELEARITHEQHQNSELVWHTRVAEMRARYDALLEQALSEHEGAVPAAQHSQVREQLAAAEEVALQLRARCHALVRDAVEECEGLWSRTLQEERDQHTRAEAAQEEKYTSLKNHLLGEAQRRVDKAETRSSKAVAACHSQMRDELTAERARCEARVAAAEERAEEAVAHREQWCREHIATAEARVAAREAALLERELAVEARAAQVEATAAERAAVTVQKHLQEAEADWEVRQTRMQRDLLAQYEGQFTAAKRAMWVSTSSIMETILRGQAAREELLLGEHAALSTLHVQAHQEEVSELTRHFEGLLAGARVEREREMERYRVCAEARETELLTQLEAALGAAEESAVHHARGVAAAQSAEVLRFTEARTQEANARWAALQRGLEEQMWQAEKQQQIFEENVRQHTDAAVAAERERSAVALAAMCEAHAQATTAAEEAWQKRESETRAQLLAEHQRQCAAHDAQLQNVRRNYEERLMEAQAASARALEESTGRNAELVKRQEARAYDTLRLQSDCFDTEMQSIMELHAGQVSALEARVDELRHQHARDLATLEARHIQEREEAGRAQRRSFEESLTLLRTELQRSTQERAKAEQEAQVRLDREISNVQAQSQQAYEAFAREQRAAMEAEAAAQAQARATARRRHESEVQAMQQELEATLVQHRAQLEEQAAAESAERQQQFNARVADFQDMLREEKERRNAVLGQLNGAMTALQECRADCEKEKLEVQRSYEQLINSMKAQLQQECTTLARGTAENKERQVAHSMVYYQAAPSAAAATATDASSSTGYSRHRPLQPLPQLHNQRVAAPLSKSRVSSTLHAPPPSPGSARTQYVTASPLSTSRALASEPSAQTATNGLNEATSPTPNAEATRERLHQLWDVLEVPAAERENFLRFIGALPVSRQRAEALRVETQRLEMQLPLLELVAQRELLLEQQQQQGRESVTQQDTAQLQSEVDRLTTQLKTDITSFERTYGQTFKYGGRRWMDVLVSS